MKNLAPEIFRQRLLIEGYYSADVTREFVEEFLNSIAAHLGLRAYGSPAVTTAQSQERSWSPLRFLQPKGSYISERVSHAKFVAAFKEWVSDGMRCP